MDQNPTKYENLEVKALRGFEAKTKKKWESEGWEYVSEVKGKLQTTILFRRVKKPISMKLVALGALGIVALASIITVGALTEDKSPTPNQSSQAQGQPDDDGSSEAAEEEPEDVEILTIENSPDLKRLLTGTDSDTLFWQEFYDKYKLQDVEIEFDGNVANMLPWDGYDYTYSVLFYAGDYDENSAIGAPMRDPSLVTPFGWKSTNPDSVIGLGTNLRIRARISDYSPKGNIFDITIVSTTVR